MPVNYSVLNIADLFMHITIHITYQTFDPKVWYFVVLFGLGEDVLMNSLI